MLESNKPSLESLIEQEEVGFEIFHPGGLETTMEMCSSITLSRDTKVLEIGSGAGLTSCFVAQHFSCKVVGVDQSDYLVTKAKENAASQKIDVSFIHADAHNLPFAGESFDVVIAECVLSLMEKDKALTEIKRVLKPGGIFAMHDICWKDTASDDLKEKLFQLESESTETLKGWEQLLERFGFSDRVISEKPNLMMQWIHESKRKLGFLGQLKLFWRAFKKWGWSGISKIKQIEDIFVDDQLSYFVASTRKMDERDENDEA